MHKVWEFLSTKFHRKICIVFFVTGIKILFFNLRIIIFYRKNKSPFLNKRLWKELDLISSSERMTYLHHLFFLNKAFRYGLLNIFRIKECR